MVGAARVIRRAASQGCCYCCKCLVECIPEQHWEASVMAPQASAPVCARRLSRPAGRLACICVHLHLHRATCSCCRPGSQCGKSEYIDRGAGGGSGARVSRMGQSSSKARWGGRGGGCCVCGACRLLPLLRVPRRRPERHQVCKFHLGAGRTVSVAMYGRSCGAGGAERAGQAARQTSCAPQPTGKQGSAPGAQPPPLLLCAGAPQLYRHLKAAPWSLWSTCRAQAAQERAARRAHLEAVEVWHDVGGQAVLPNRVTTCDGSEGRQQAAGEASQALLETTQQGPAQGRSGSGPPPPPAACAAALQPRFLMRTVPALPAAHPCWCAAPWAPRPCPCRRCAGPAWWSGA